MKVVIDTCELFPDLPLTSWPTRLLLSQSRGGKLEVVLPEVVVRELVRHAAKRIEVATDKVKRGSASLEKLGLAASNSPPSTPKLITEFEDSLRTRLSEEKVAVQPVPDVSSADLLERSIASRKPFNGGDKNSDAGLQDTLIWLSVLEVAKAHEPVVLVTSNTDDFADADKKSLHPDLAAELERGMTVDLCVGLQTFLDENVPEVEQALLEAQDLTKPDEGELSEQVRDEIAEIFRDYDLWPYHSRVTFVQLDDGSYVGSASPQMIHVEGADLLSLQIDRALEFDSDAGTAILEMTASAELLVSMVLDKGEAYWIAETSSNVSFHDFDYNETYAQGEAYVHVKARLQGLFSRSDRTIEDLEMLTIDDLPESDSAHRASEQVPS